MAGSLDDSPPVILGPKDYLAAVVLLPGDDLIRYSLYRSPGETLISMSEIKFRLTQILRSMDSDD